MSDRNIDPERSEFSRRVFTPEPSGRLGKPVADARTDEHERSGLGRRFADDSRLGLSLAALAASIVLSAGLLFAAYGRGGTGDADPAGSPSASPEASSSEMASASPDATATAEISASPSPLVSPSPTHDAAFTFGPPGKFVAVGPTTIGLPSVGLASYAARLLDGRVLLTDGSNVQLFDPGTNQFGASETLDAPHVRGTATGLPDGTALIAGGMDGQTGDALNSATTYDPNTGKSRPAGSLVEGRFDQHEVALSDGKVLVMGGFSMDSDQTPLRTAEIYDPTTRQFTRTGDMVVSRGCATTVRMSDGKVLIAGGDWAYGSRATDSYVTAEVFDPGTGKFTATGSMSTGRDCAAGALLPDGRVLVSGGDTGSVTVGTADVYDPKTRTFAPTGNMAIGRFSHSAIALADGRVLITGGLIEPGVIASVDPGILAVTDQSYLDSAELYNPNTGKFTKIGPMLSRRVGHTATLLEDGRVLLAGGNLDATSAEAYVP
jgi:hypothetical protein